MTFPKLLLILSCVLFGTIGIAAWKKSRNRVNEAPIVQLAIELEETIRPAPPKPPSPPLPPPPPPPPVVITPAPLPVSTPAPAPAPVQVPVVKKELAPVAPTLEKPLPE